MVYPNQKRKRVERRASGTWRTGERDIQRHMGTNFAPDSLTTEFGLVILFGSGTKEPTVAEESLKWSKYSSCPRRVL